MGDALRRLETAVMELGSEIYVIKNQLNRTNDQNQKLIKVIILIIYKGQKSAFMAPGVLLKKKSMICVQ